MTIRKLLVANRGEIACRIMRTCKHMGIATVAVYSDADKGALHVATADEAVRIGPAEASGSYLNVDAILAAVKQTGADAIHPGYGFLSERVALAEFCAANGIAWVGPSANAIARMGSKIESKRIAEAAGVPCVPGYHGSAQDDDTLLKAARSIGFPVLIKASAGGGGRGMRAVHAEAELIPALALARAEAEAGFGDPSLLIEKLILRPRHIEVQLAGDKHGNLVHLFERECSIQRNYQKVVEEAPAPNLSDDIRSALFDAAVKLGKAIDYDSLGTVEFILDADGGGPWFLEMNTRLQVEHPVTEFITGLDLVEWQIRVADGETLPLSQTDITHKGSAIEARVTAEDPAAGYRPALGAIELFVAPTGVGVRTDTGVQTGSVVTPYYDSLIAKIIAYGPDRTIAATRLSAALSNTAILGIKSSQAFLRDIVDHPQFRAGDLTTRFIAEAFPDGWHDTMGDTAGDIAAACAIWAVQRGMNAADAGLGPWQTLGGFRVTSAVGHRGWVSLDVTTADNTVEVEITNDRNQFSVRYDDAEAVLKIDLANKRAAVELGGAIQEYEFVCNHKTVDLSHNGSAAEFKIAPRIENAGIQAASEAAGAGQIVAPLPGLISKLNIEPDQIVSQGDAVIVLEAMKLMYSLPAQISGKVTQIYCSTGETVKTGEILALIETCP